MEIRIEPLERSHNRSNFDCGVKELNHFLRKYSFQNQKSHVSKTFVAIDDDQVIASERNLLGFYTLTTGQINFARRVHKNSKSLQRMFGASGNPTAESLFSVIHALQEAEGIKLTAGVAHSSYD